MNILFINGSPNSNGNTAALAKELLQGKELRIDSIEVDIPDENEEAEATHAD